MKKTDLAYYAGFLDGEGCIRLSLNKKTGCRWLTVEIKHTNHWILISLQFAFGGSIKIHKAVNENQRPQWHWTVTSRKALVFLKEVNPYLKLKRGEVEIAIQFQQRKHLGNPLLGNQKALEEAEDILLRKLKREVSP